MAIEPGSGAGDRYVSAGGHQTFCIECGAGSPVLLIHGSSVAVDSQLTWFRAIDHLARTRRVIAFDQIGFGKTGIAEGSPYPDRLERAQHAQAVIDALGLDDITVVGHSEGGFIAAHLAITNPGRISKLVIVTSGGTAPRLGGERDADWMTASSKVYDFASRCTDADSYATSEPYLAEVGDEAFERLLRLNFEEAKTSGNLRIFRDRVIQSGTGYGDYTALQEKWIYPHIGEFDGPTLLVWAGRDPTVPVERGLALLGLIPGGEFHLFRDSGHWVMHQQARGFNRLLDGWI